MNPTYPKQVREEEERSNATSISALEVDLHERGFEEDENEKEDRLRKLLLYSVIAAGFATGFWGIILVLLLMKSFRYACLRLVEDAADMIYVEVVIKVRRIKKWLVRNHVQG
ncbi:hypothetical protein Lal_00036931 [Lupinus albus]|nr:hypothetical protein Lal_00036931 [Lupinus albus]